MNGSKRQTENDQEFGLELSTCLPSRPIDWCVASGKLGQREDWYDKFGLQHASIRVAGRIKQAMDMDCCQKNEREDTGLSRFARDYWLLSVF